MSIRVLSPGLTLLQDEGRKDFTQFGVPVSGAFNQVSYRLACELIGEPYSPTFEILGGPFRILAEEDCVVAIVGEAVVSLDGSIAGTDSAFIVKAGQTLSIDNLNSPAYLAVSGLEVIGVLGSVSWDSLSSLGTPPVSAGDVFRTSMSEANLSAIGSFLQSSNRTVRTLRYIPGPHLTSVNREWQVKGVSRSGIRLHSETPLEKNQGTIKSFPVRPGTIQVPSSGQPIILGPDCGTTGGYPVAGVVISADLHLLAQLQPEQVITLQECSIEEAKIANNKLDNYLANAVVRPTGMGYW